MKGPYERLKYDLRRVWECPECHHHERTEVGTTCCFCRCRSKDDPQRLVVMKLVEDDVRRVERRVSTETEP